MINDQRCVGKRVGKQGRAPLREPGKKADGRQEGDTDNVKG